MKNPVPEFLNRTIDEPLRGLAALCLRTLQNRCGVSPLVGLHIATAPSSLAMAFVGDRMTRSGEAMLWPGTVFLMLGLFGVGLGIGTVSAAAKKTWNARAYLRRLSEAAALADANRGSRLLHLAVVVINAAATWATWRAGQEAGMLCSAEIAMLFLSIVCSEYLSAAEPPRPGDGDASKRSVAGLYSHRN